MKQGSGGSEREVRLFIIRVRLVGEGAGNGGAAAIKALLKPGYPAPEAGVLAVHFRHHRCDQKEGGRKESKKQGRPPFGIPHGTGQRCQGNDQHQESRGAERDGFHRTRSAMRLSGRVGKAVGHWHE